MAAITLPMVTGAGTAGAAGADPGWHASALEEQGAVLIGGHTMEARSAPVHPTTRVQAVLTINGATPSPWSKAGLQPGDALLLSRPLGTGVLFAGAMACTAAQATSMPPSTMAQEPHAAAGAEPASSHSRLHRHHRFRSARSSRRDAVLSASIKVELEAEAIRLRRGHEPAGTGRLQHAGPPTDRHGAGWPRSAQASPSAALLELLVDPQPWPLLLACHRDAVSPLMATGGGFRSAT